MRRLSCAVFALFMPAFAIAAPVEKLYYLGEVKMSAPTGNPMGSQVLLLEKTQDPDKSQIIEKALLVQADGRVQEFTARLAVKEDGSFTLSDDAKQTEGSGKLFGPAWKWTYFKGTFKAGNGMVIDDENFFADESAATARKKITMPDGKVLMYMDMTLKTVTPKTYEILRKGLLKSVPQDKK